MLVTTNTGGIGGAGVTGAGRAGAGDAGVGRERSAQNLTGTAWGGARVAGGTQDREIGAVGAGPAEGRAAGSWMGVICYELG